MTLAVGDLIQETTSTTGTGTLTLSGAVAGYQSFAVIGTGNTTYYCIRSGTNKEVGIGTYTASGTTLSRDTVLYSSAGGTTKITVAAGATVINTYPAETSVSGGGGGTYPTIQPTLNLDFANTKLLDPRITFVRNSTAAYYDGQTTAMAEQNLLLQSNTFSNAAWVATNGTIASGVTDPAGTTTAFSFTATGAATLYQTLTTTATPYTLSFYIQRVTGTGAVNLTLDGTILTPQTITGSWARYSVTATPTAASHTIGIQLAVSGDAVNIFTSQLENRSSMTAANITTTAAITNYIPVLMTAPAGVARFDCDPITRNSLGLLIEESRTNFLTYSVSISPLTAYTEFSTTINTLQNISPDGTLSASLLTPSAVNSEHYAYTSNTAPLTSGTSYTYSIYVKAKGYNFVTLFLGNGAFPSAGRMANFNLLAGVVDGAQSGVTTSIFSVGDGWYRCSITATCVLSSASIITGMGAQNISNPSGNNLTFTGDGYSGIYIWGAQAEAGSFATSYIPTVASTVTRAADQASMTGTNFSSWYNQAQGTMYCAANPYNTMDKIPFSISNSGGYGNSIYQALGNSDFIVVSNGTTQVVLNGGVPLANTVNKTASSYAPNSFAVSLNAATVVASSTGSIPTVDRATIGGLASNTSNQLNGTIQKISYYPVALSSSNLVALTS